MKFSILAAALGLGLLAPGAALATDSAAPAASPSPAASASPTPTMTAKPDKAATEAKAQECSKEADAQGLHGHKRKVFREKCKKGEK